MEINYQTENLIVFHYPGGAGGKLISLCLAINERVLHQDRYLAEKKIKYRLSEEQSAKISHMVIRKSRTGRHFELGCLEFSGFNAGTPLNDREKVCNDLWRTCTNQKDFMFCMCDNSTGTAYQEYTCAKHIVLKNYEWILEKRNFDLSKIKTPDINLFSDHVEMDMENLHDRDKFINSIDIVCSYLGIQIKNKSLIEPLRSEFMKKFKLGFND